MAGIVALVLLGMQLAADPATGISISSGPFTDEGYSVLGARNRVLLGHWATDEWKLYLVQLPFTLLMTGVFEIFGVGILQARIVSIVASVLMVSLLAALIARRFGEAAGVVAGIALAASALFLYYGRLALLEPTTVAFLVLGLGLLHLRLGGARPGDAGLGGAALSSSRGQLLLGAAAGVGFALAIGTKAIALLPVVAVLAASLVASAGLPGVRLRVAAAVGALAASAAGWLLLVSRQPTPVGRILAVWPDETLPASLDELWQRVGDYFGNSDGAIPLAAPLLVGGAIGLVLAAVRWRRLDPPQRLLVAAALAWFAVVALFLLLVPYRPNRYAVVLLPPLAILAGAGIGLLGPLLRRWLLPVAAVGALAMAAPGGVLLAGWMGSATYRLPAIQEELRQLIGSSAAVEGPSAVATLAMRVPVPTIIGQPMVNVADLYDRDGVRWIIARPDYEPPWVWRHREEWAKREIVACYAWPPGTSCLSRLP
jgi:4-amino-4-deoxy-L-arabinose transferase-like glycosyltransferase